MPGMEARAPERTETSKGFAASPNLRPVLAKLSFWGFRLHAAADHAGFLLSEPSNRSQNLWNAAIQYLDY